MRFSAYWVIVWLCVCVFQPGTAAAVPDDYNYGYGPLNLRTSSPGQSLRFVQYSITPGAIKPGWGVYLGVSTSNLWIDDTEYLMDYEVFDGYAAVSYGVDTRLGFGFFVDNRIYYGGILDGFIENFHDTFGIEQSGRDKWPRYETHYVAKDKDGNVVRHEDDMGDLLNNNGIGAVAHYVLTHGNTWLPAFGATLAFRYGLRGPRSPHIPLDLGVGLGMSKKLTEGWYTYGYVGYTNFGQTEFDDFEMGFENDAWSAMFALVRQWQEISLVAQYNFHEGVVKDYGRFHEPAHEFTLGLKWLVEDYGLFEIGFIENFIIVDNSNDFGLHLFYAYRF